MKLLAPVGVTHSEKERRGAAVVLLRWGMCARGEHVFLSSPKIQVRNAVYMETVDYMHHRHSADILQNDRYWQKRSA